MADADGPVIYVDADACPVKDETLRVAGRYGLAVAFVSNGGIRPSRDPMVRTVVVPHGADAADDWIVQNVSEGDIVITADIPHYGGYSAGEPGPGEGGGGVGVDWKAVHGQFDRHGPGDARPQSAFARNG